MGVKCICVGSNWIKKYGLHFVYTAVGDLLIMLSKSRGEILGFLKSVGSKTIRICIGWKSFALVPKFVGKPSINLFSHTSLSPCYEFHPVQTLTYQVCARTKTQAKLCFLKSRKCCDPFYSLYSRAFDLCTNSLPQSSDWNAYFKVNLHPQACDKCRKIWQWCRVQKGWGPAVPFCIHFISQRSQFSPEAAFSLVVIFQQGKRTAFPTEEKGSAALNFQQATGILLFTYFMSLCWII